MAYMMSTMPQNTVDLKWESLLMNYHIPAFIIFILKLYTHILVLMNFLKSNFKIEICICLIKATLHHQIINDLDN